MISITLTYIFYLGINMKSSTKLISLIVIPLASVIITYIYGAYYIQSSINKHFYSKVSDDTKQEVSYNLNGYDIKTTSKLNNGYQLSSSVKIYIKPFSLTLLTKSIDYLSDRTGIKIGEIITIGSVNHHSASFHTKSSPINYQFNDGIISFPAGSGSSVFNKNDFNTNYTFNGSISITNEAVGTPTEFIGNIIKISSDIQGNRKLVVTNKQVKVGALSVTSNQHLEANAYIDTSKKLNYLFTYQALALGDLNDLSITLGTSDVSHEIDDQIQLLASNALNQNIETTALQGRALEIMADAFKYGSKVMFKLNGNVNRGNMTQPINLSLAAFTPEENRGAITKSNAFTLLEGITVNLKAEAPLFGASMFVPEDMLIKGLQMNMLTLKDDVFRSDFLLKDGLITVNGHKFSL